MSHTDVPLGSERSSGSRVRFPVRTTTLRLDAAMKEAPSIALSGCVPTLDGRSEIARGVGAVCRNSGADEFRIALGGSDLRLGALGGSGGSGGGSGRRHGGL